MEARYLIIGGGMTADAAAKAIRKADPAGKIVLVGDETQAPYKRPPLSKDLWKGADEEKADLKTAATGAELLLGRTVTSLDLDAHVAVLDDGEQVRYERLLLATGAHARALPNVTEDERVIAYRHIDDYHRVRQLASKGSSAVVIGGGFIGSEMAAGLTLAGVQVTMVFPEDGIGGGRLPPDLSKVITADYVRRGVTVMSGRGLASVERRGDKVAIKLDDGSEVTADFLLIGIGAVPNDGLARAAGLKVDNGVHVDSSLRALGQDGRPRADVFAAGDVASFDWRPLGRRMRIEHEDNAYMMGAAAGSAMAASMTAGADLPEYDHLPFFYSDLFDAGYEAVGLLDGRLRLVEDWRKPGEEGVVYYLDDGVVKGVLLWNTWGQVDAARDLIVAGGQHDSAELIGRLPADG